MNKPQEWHDERRQGIGGSDVAAALGVSPWKSQLELWGEKTGLVPDDFDGNEFTYWGEALEQILMDRFNADHKNLVMGGQKSRPHKDHPCLRANVDGIIYEHDGDALGIWEAKTASTEFTEVPVHYQLQVQHYMYVYDLPFAIVSVLFHGNLYKEFRIERDPKYAVILVPQLLNFWQKVVDKLPVFKPTSMKDLGIKYVTDTEGEVCKIDETTWYAMTVQKIQRATLNSKNHKATAEKLKVDLAQSMKQQGHKSLKLNGKAVATIVTVKDSKAFDMVKFKKSEPKLHEAYLSKQRKGYTSLRVSK